MLNPILVRSLTESERERLKAGLRSSDGFELRRCQIILASERGEHAIAIAQSVGCSDETVREAQGSLAPKPTDLWEAEQCVDL